MSTLSCFFYTFWFLFLCWRRGRWSEDRRGFLLSVDNVRGGVFREQESLGLEVLYYLLYPVNVRALRITFRQ